MARVVRAAANRRRRSLIATLEKSNQIRVDFLRRYEFTEEQFKQTGLAWEVLDNVRDQHTAMLKELQTTATYVVERLQTVPAVHSLKSRIKDAEHLIAKIIRKKDEGHELDCSNYENHITDLVGVRALHLFKDDWRPIHDFINHTWELHEQPIAYVRDGDGDPLGFADAGCRVQTHPFGYRSIHYVIKSQPAKCTRLVELQVRTIFEEGWSEIDHKVRYPRQSDNPELALFLRIFNRLAGSADEMGTFTKILATSIREQAARTKESERQIQDKEKELRNTISQLQISKQEKLSLQKQIAEVNKPPERSSEGPSTLLAALNIPTYQELLRLNRQCSLCGKSLPSDTSISIGSLMSPAICPECASKRGRAIP
jgi:ppGpp synthetase/RelA/SpoT-type nucleotidyltranferase